MFHVQILLYCIYNKVERATYTNQNEYDRITH